MQDRDLIRDVVPFFLSDKTIFAAVLVRAILQADIVSERSRNPSLLATKAYGVALRLLRQHLILATNKVSDLVICALVFLIAFDASIVPSCISEDRCSTDRD
jgi:hypothetical protein